MVEHLRIHDKTGLRKNVMEILDLQSKRELKAVGICFARKDGSIHTFWNGDDMNALIMATTMMEHDILHSRPVIYEETCDPLEDPEEGPPA